MKIKASISLDKSNNNDDDVEKIMKEKSKKISEFLKGFSKKVDANWYSFFCSVEVDCKHSSPLALFGSKEKEPPMLTLAKLKMCEHFIFKDDETNGIDDIKETIQDEFGVKDFILIFNIDGNVAAIRNGSRFSQVLALTEAQITLITQHLITEMTSELVTKMVRDLG